MLWLIVALGSLVWVLVFYYEMGRRHRCRLPVSMGSLLLSAQDEDAFWHLRGLSQHDAAFQGHHRSHGSLSRRALCLLVGCRVGAEHEGAVLRLGRDHCRELASASPSDGLLCS